MMLDKLTQHLPSQQSQSLRRRVSQLTMDLILDTIRLTPGSRPLQQLVQRLRNNGLYPLPPYHYTPAYTLFSQLYSSRIGLLFLRCLFTLF